MSHLWRGYLAKGGLVLFGSFLFLLWLGRELRYTTVEGIPWIRLGIWVILWSAWSIIWYWDRLRSSTYRPSPGRIVSSVVLMLILANVLMIVLIVQMLSSPMY